MAVVPAAPANKPFPNPQPILCKSMETPFLTVPDQKRFPRALSQAGWKGMMQDARKLGVYQMDGLVDFLQQACDRKRLLQKSAFPVRHVQIGEGVI